MENQSKATETLTANSTLIRTVALDAAKQWWTIEFTESGNDNLVGTLVSRTKNREGLDAVSGMKVFHSSPPF